ncbi:GEVED domain-containing protein [Photobacterium leiognathi subsp. mandapamensis]|uniref:GEVED domain-containing protein n=1 Tax=Photobacterium leiognathi TaxID=553611 RepID=UPI003AF35551
MKLENIKIFKLFIVFAIFLFITAFSSSSHASHWRGGAMTWVSSDMDGDGIRNDVTVTLKTACRIGASCQGGVSLSPSISPTSQTITVDQEVNGAYRLEVQEFVFKNLDLNTTYTAAYNSCCRIAGLQNNANGNWSIQSTILLKDGNRSPLIDMPILYQVPQRYTDGTVLVNYQKLIPALDPDGDTTKFRMANTSELGGGVNPGGMSIDENTGLLTWTNSGNLTAGLYSAGIVVEDYDDQGNMKSKTHYDIMWELKGAAEIADYSGYPSDEVIVKKGNSYTFTITGTNIEVISLGDINGALTEPTPNTFTFTPGPVGSGLDPGIYPMTFQVVDTTGTYVDSYFTVTYIVPDPRAPELHDIHGDFSGYFSGDLVHLDNGNDATSTDLDSTHYNTGQLKITPSYQDAANERVYIQSAGDGAGEIRFDNVTNEVFYEGDLIGVVDPAKDGDGVALQINFTTDDATPTAAGALMRSIYFQDNSGIDGNRKISLYIVDDTGLSNIYALNVSAVLSDTGDALLTGDQAYHAERDANKNGTSDLRLGTLWDGDGGIQNAAADADDNDGTDDEDGVTFPLFGNSVGSNVDIVVNIQEESDNGRQVHGWIDFNGDGVLDNSTEKVITDTTAVVGDNTYPVSIPNSVQPGERFLRVRLCSSGETCNTQGGKTYDGEVEDYLIRIGDIDFGDAPDSGASTAAENYLTLDAHGGPYQFIDNDLYIGSTAPDAEQGTLQDANATADDLDSTNDEGGLNIVPIQTSSTDYKIYVATTNRLTTMATLVGWVDFNRNGQFEDSEGQYAYVPAGAVQASTELEWNGISPSNHTHLFMRLRLISRVINDISEVSSVGGDSVGEIEDHLITMSDIDLGDAPDSYGVDPSLGGGLSPYYQHREFIPWILKY